MVFQQKSQVVLAAVTRSPWALEFASQDRRNRPKFIPSPGGVKQCHFYHPPVITIFGGMWTPFRDMGLWLFSSHEIFPWATHVCRSNPKVLQGGGERWSIENVGWELLGISWDMVHCVIDAPGNMPGIFWNVQVHGACSSAIWWGNIWWCSPIWRFPENGGYPHSWMVYSGKSKLDDLGVPLF